MTKQLIERIFSTDGPLAEEISGFLPRKAQLEMALQVAATLEEEKGRLITEAGTGTGKSFAYLAAALLSDKKVMISTATLALQDQLFLKDIPVMLKIVYKLTGKRKTAVLLKGRNNYLCRLRADNTTFMHDLIDMRHNQLLDHIRAWSRETTTGDRSEIPELSDDSPLWTELNARSEVCIGQDCPLYSDCFITSMRNEAQNADLVVVNHALLCADRTLRINTALSSQISSGIGDQAFGQVIPNADAWIIDEAHALEDTATRYFGVSVSLQQIRYLARDLALLKPYVSLVDQTSYSYYSETIASHFNKIVEAGFIKTQESRIELGVLLSQEDVQEHMQHLLGGLRTLQTILASASSTDTLQNARMKALDRRLQKIHTELHFILLGDAAKAGYVGYANRDNLSISAIPVDVESILEKSMWSSNIPVVLTSATLAFNESLGWFKNRIGLGKQPVHELQLEAPFDYQNKAGLYIPKNAPSSQDSNFDEFLQKEIQFLVEKSKGGAFLLFTSHRALQYCYETLKKNFSEELGLLVLKQGQAPKMELIKQFVQAHEKQGAVLFATHSFWEGVDVKGHALRLVVIDRLPFKSPQDPLQKARQERLEAQEISSFSQLSLPEAALTLKQGVGRLIRTVEDSGVVAVIDGRLRQKSYGKVFLKTLPPMRILSNRSDFEQFWQANVAIL